MHLQASRPPPIRLGPWYFEFCVLVFGLVSCFVLRACRLVLVSCFDIRISCLRFSVSTGMARCATGVRVRTLLFLTGYRGHCRMRVDASHIPMSNIATVTSALPKSSLPATGGPDLSRGARARRCPDCHLLPHGTDEVRCRSFKNCCARIGKRAGETPDFKF